MIQELMTRLGVTKTQAEMALYSGAIPTTIDPEPFIQHWERKLQVRERQVNDNAIKTRQ